MCWGKLPRHPGRALALPLCGPWPRPHLAAAKLVELRSSVNLVAMPYQPLDRPVASLNSPELRDVRYAHIAPPLGCLGVAAFGLNELGERRCVVRIPRWAPRAERAMRASPVRRIHQEWAQQPQADSARHEALRPLNPQCSFIIQIGPAGLRVTTRGQFTLNPNSSEMTT
jgi:hypothetical protein